VCEKRVVSESNKHWCQPALCNTTMSAKDEHVATAGAGEGEDDLEDNTPPESSEEKRVTVDSYTVRRLPRFAHTPSLLFSSWGAAVHSHTKFAA
jgi:hypothetical protein